MSNFHDHEDRQGVFVRLWTIDLLDGDFHAALLFNQLLWWHRPNLDGTSKLRYERDGHQWLLRADDGWQPECRMTTKQVRRVRSLLVAKGLIEHRRFKLNGAPTSAWRPIFEVIREARAADQDSDSPKTRTSPQGAVPSAPQGQVPIPSLVRDLPIEETPVVQVFEAWKASAKKTAATKLDAARTRLITAALKDYPLDDVLDAVRGWEHSAYHRGENPNRTVFNDLGLLLRDASHIERFRDMARGPRERIRNTATSHLPPSDRVMAEDPDYWKDPDE